MKNKKIINIILVLLILLNVIIMTILLIDKNNNKDQYDIDIKNFDEFMDVYDNETMGIYYKRFVQKLVEETLPSTYTEVKGLNDDELKEHYEQNTDLIAMTIGIENYEDFKKLVPQLSMYEDVDAKYKQIKILKNSCALNEDTGYIDTTVRIKYEDNKKLTLKISMMDYQLAVRTPGSVKLYKVTLD